MPEPIALFREWYDAALASAPLRHPGWLAAAFLMVAAASGATAQPTPVAVPACANSAGPDRDADGLDDGCERQLARTFAPLLVSSSTACNWDPANARIGGGYFHAVQRVGAVTRIAYMPAYFQDCGWRGRKCWLPFVDCAPHAGDSELVVVELAPAADGADWHVTGVFLSAHCFGRSGGACRWYRGGDLRKLTWSDSAPVVWVAEGRNAGYPSRAACDRGHHFIDTCDRHDVLYRFPVHHARNIGSRRTPASPDGCVRGAVLNDAAATADALECFWRSDAPFRGWQNAGAGVTPYDRYLREIAGF